MSTIIAGPIKVEMDAAAVTNLVNNLQEQRLPQKNFVHDCRSLMAQLGVKTMKHVYREANKCADLSATTPCLDTISFLSFTAFPSFISMQLADDAVGISYPGFCMTL